MSAGSVVQSPRHSRAALRWALGLGIATVVLVAVDHLTGPFIRVSVGFAFAVAVVAYRWTWPAAVGLGLLFEISRLWLVLRSDVPGLVVPELANVGLNLLLFGVLAAAVRRVSPADRASANRPLPVCGGCGWVRDASGRWMRFESFVTTVTSGRFTHTICPECESRFGR